MNEHLAEKEKAEYKWDCLNQEVGEIEARIETLKQEAMKEREDWMGFIELAAAEKELEEAKDKAEKAWRKWSEYE